MFAMSSGLKCAALGVAGSLLASAAQAGMAVDVLNGTLYQRGTWANFGYSFEVNEAVQVDALGLWDYLADGLGEAHPVGLWDSAGNLLAQAIVDNSSAAVSSANGAHAWRFSDIAPIDLQPGTYKLGAFYATTADPFVANGANVPANLVWAPQVSFGSSYVTTGGTEFFSEPNTVTSFNPGFFGPNANFSRIPEPASLAGLLLGGVLLARSRR